MKTKRSSLFMLGFAVVASSATVLGCSMGSVLGSSPAQTTPATPGTSITSHSLTIANNSSSSLCFVRWIDGTGQQRSFASDTVYDATLQKTVSGMLPGSKSTLSVEPGSNPLVFFFADGGTEYRTVAPITVAATDADTLFSLSDATAIKANQ